MRGRDVLGQLIELAVRPTLRCRADILACVMFEVIGIGLAALGPYLLKVLVDALTDSKVVLWYLLLLVLGFVIAWTATSLLSSVRNIYSTRINSHLTQHLTMSAIAGYLSNGKWREIDNERFHGLIERLPYSLIVVLDGLVWRTFPLVLQLALSLAVIARLMSWRYVACLGGLACVFVAASWLGLSRQMAVAERYNETVARSGGLVGDILRNARRVVSNGAVGFELANVESAYLQREKEESGFAWALLQLSAVQWFALGLCLMVLLGLSAADIASKRLAPSDFILLQAYAIRLLVPLAGVGYVLSQTTSAVMTIREILDIQREGDGPNEGIPTLQIQRPSRVEVQALTFTYLGGQGGLNGVSVDFPAGSFSAIVGKNGSGKSTLAQLIAGQLTPSGGSVRFNGQLVMDVPENDRARQVLYVPQRSTLLNRDLRSNLFYPPARHSEADVVRLLQAWDFLEGGRPIELDRVVGTQGDALSGGQVQKLELARLMGVQVPCLILDESTSALDPVSEGRIISDLRKAIGYRTTIILVTHRSELAKSADQVIWLDAGTVAGVGGHSELKLQSPQYKMLWGGGT